MVKVSRAAITGALIGWFVLSPIMFHKNFPTFVDKLVYFDMGLIIVIAIGIILGYLSGGRT